MVGRRRSRNSSEWASQLEGNRGAREADVIGPGARRLPRRRVARLLEGLVEGQTKPSEEGRSALGVLSVG